MRDRGGRNSKRKGSKKKKTGLLIKRDKPGVWQVQNSLPSFEARSASKNWKNIRGTAKPAGKLRGRYRSQATWGEKNTS